jgi:hypothetical protein
MMGGRVKLEHVGTDPLGLGKELSGQTLSASGWQQLAPLSKASWTCDGCSAQFYAIDKSRLCLDWVEDDPRGVGQTLLGKTYYRAIWAKHANGLSAKVGNTFCPTCQAQFDYDKVDARLRLVSCDRDQFPRAAAFLGQIHSMESWSLLSAGKNSPVRGWLCSDCQAEFDDEAHGMKLVGGPPSWADMLAQTRSFRNWHRLARNLPNEDEEASLRKELARLDEQHKDETSRLIKAAEERRTAIEHERQERTAGIERRVHELVKQSFLEGFIAFELENVTISPYPDERVDWESVVCLVRHQISHGGAIWESYMVGFLVVTDRRVIFQPETGETWSIPLQALLAAEYAPASIRGWLGFTGGVPRHEYLTGRPLREQGICLLSVDGLDAPVVFGPAWAMRRVRIGDRTFPLELTCHDLWQVFQGRCHWAVV